MKSTKLLNSLHIPGTFCGITVRLCPGLHWSSWIFRLIVDHLHIVSHVSILRLATKWGGTLF